MQASSFCLARIHAPNHAGSQPRRGLQPMVPEFKSILTHPANATLPPNSRQLSSFPRGITASCDTTSTEIDSMVSVGVYHTPDEFVAEAAKIGHPTRLHSFFPDEIAEVVSNCLSKNRKDVAARRTEEIRRWISLARDLGADERALKDQLGDRRREILKDKKLMLFKRLLEDAGHEDANFVEQLYSGFDLTGMLPESCVFSRKPRPATMSCEELRRVSDLGRDGILQISHFVRGP